MTEKFNEIKKEIPQINKETGISFDYINELANLISIYNFGGISSLIKTITKRPFGMKKYEEVYTNYQNIINNQNRESIKELNMLAGLLNEILKDPNSINEDSFRKTINRICFLVYGDNHISI